MQNSRSQKTGQYKAFADRNKQFIAQLIDDTKRVEGQKAFQSLMDTISNFHRYSLANQILIAVQNPEATQVAGIKKWNKMGRKIIKGQKSIRIWAPSNRKKRKPTTSTGSDEHQDQVKSKVNENEDTEKSISNQRFLLVPVFDVSQTEGEPLPSVADVYDMDGLEDSSLTDLYLQCGIEVAQSMGYRVLLDDPCFQDDPTTHGMAVYASKKILLNPALGSNDRFQVLIHEMAHMRLHSNADLPTEIKELEAEMTAYIAARHFGLDSKAPEYISLNTCGIRTEDKINACLRRVSTECNTIIQLLEAAIERRQDQITGQVSNVNNASITTRQEDTGASKPVQQKSKPKLFGML